MVYIDWSPKSNLRALLDLNKASIWYFKEKVTLIIKKQKWVLLIIVTQTKLFVASSPEASESKDKK